MLGQFQWGFPASGSGSMLSEPVLPITTGAFLKWAAVSVVVIALYRWMVK